MTSLASVDREFMSGALSLAARNLGDTWPNPSVGCVIVKDGVVVGRGWTQSGGRPHAETEALARAGNHAKGGTAYVTLEPCSHYGQTPPCVDALTAAELKRVVIAQTDKNPEVAGQGIERLKAAGIEVDVGVCETEAAKLNAGFFLKVESFRPLFALKSATTLDGRIALASGESKWITGEKGRAAAHALRARFDAILVGSNTVLTDDPELTCRMPGYSGRPKVRIVLDRRGRTPETAKLIKSAKESPTWIVTSQGTDCSMLSDRGAKILEVEGSNETEFAANAAVALANEGLTRVMIEGGAAIAASFLQADLIDEILWFRAGGVIGADGAAGIGPLGLGKIVDISGFQRGDSLVFGSDTLDFLDRVRG